MWMNFCLYQVVYHCESWYRLCHLNKPLSLKTLLLNTIQRWVISSFECPYFSSKYPNFTREREREREVYLDDIVDTKIHSDTQLDINKNSSTWLRLHWFFFWFSFILVDILEWSFVEISFFKIICHIILIVWFFSYFD